MGKLHVVGTFLNIDPAKLSAFKQVVAEAVALAKNEEGTLRYEYFLSPDETTCVVLETYASSEAALAHMTGMGSAFIQHFERTRRQEFRQPALKGRGGDSGGAHDFGASSAFM